MEGPLPRPAPALDAADRQRLRPHARRRRLLARQDRPAAAAAHLRHRVADEGRAARLPAAPRGGREARPPQARPRARPLLVPRGGGLRPVGVAPARRDRARRDGAARPQAPHRAGLQLRLHAAHHEEGSLRHLEPPRHLRRGHVAAHPHGRGARRGRQRHQGRRRLLPQAHELPDAHPHLQGALAQLPRPAAAAGRERHGLPQRALGRAARADARARLHAGRRPPVRHPRPSGRRRRMRCVASRGRPGSRSWRSRARPPSTGRRST